MRVVACLFHGASTTVEGIQGSACVIEQESTVNGMVLEDRKLSWFVSDNGDMLEIYSAALTAQQTFATLPSTTVVEDELAEFVEGEQVYCQRWGRGAST